MTFLPALIAAFAALCVWLMVRIINRRERWAKWALAVTLSLPVLYVVSFGPACWIYGRTQYHRLPRIYQPFEPAFDHRSPVRRPLLWFAGIGMGPKGSIALPKGKSGRLCIISAEGMHVY